MGEFFSGRGLFFFLSTIMVIFTLFRWGILSLAQIDQTSHLFYKFITVVSNIYTALSYVCMVRRFILFFLPPGTLISGRVRTQNIISYLICYSFSRMKVGYPPPQKKKYSLLYT